MQLVLYSVSNGNRTEWSPIRSVIIRVINKIGRPRSGSPICLLLYEVGLVYTLYVSAWDIRGWTGVSVIACLNC